MDVQALGQSPALSSPADPSSGLPQSAAPQTGGGIPVPASQSAQPPDAGGAQTTQPNGLPAFQLPHEVAKVFTGGAASNVTVSFQVAHFPNEIVTVFKNSQTGDVITQVPSEIMIKLAEFFDQVAGVVLDKSA